MRRVTRSELEALAPVWDAITRREPTLDPFCSSSAWPLAFHDAFEPDRPLWCATGDDALVVLAESQRSTAPGLLEPLENMWGFSSPLIGHGAATLLAESLLERPRAVLLLGLPADGSALRPLSERLRGRFGGRALEPTHRYIASLEGGIDGWLSRRTASFRRNLRQALRRVAECGIRFRRVLASTPEEIAALYATILDVESRSWKGRAGSGADRDPMRRFYAALWSRLGERGALRVVLAERDERAVGYLHGALVGDHFRGLQFSFADAWRAVGLGNALQMEVLRWLVEEGAARYDLGGQSAYKARWAETHSPLWSLLIHPRAG